MQQNANTAPVERPGSLVR